LKTKVNAIGFGLKENSEELQTKEIQSAIDFCFSKGGGEVEIPSGKYYTGDIRVRSNVTLHLLENACLVGSDNPEDYFNYLNDKVEPLTEDEITDAPYVHLSTIHGETEYVENKSEYRFKRIAGSRWNNAIIRVINAENIKVIGEKNSVIDGVNCFDETGEEEYRGPHGMTFFNCRNIELEGYTIQNTGNWAHNLLFCDNITVNGITVLAGHDGFDASVCNNLTITNSEFYTGDDCIAGFGNVNTYIKDCVLNSSCSAMRFGGSNVLVEKCHIYGPGKYCFRGSLSDEDKRMSAPSVSEGNRTNMLSAFTYYADYSLPINVSPGNIVITDCKIDMANRFLHYNYSGNETWQKNRPLESICFKNIKATDICMPLTAYGDKDVPVTVELENVDISIQKGFETIDFMHAANYKKIAFDNVKLSNFKGKSLIKSWTESGKIEINKLDCDIDENNYLTLADEEFVCQTI